MAIYITLSTHELEDFTPRFDWVEVQQGRHEKGRQGRSWRRDEGIQRSVRGREVTAKLAEMRCCERVARMSSYDIISNAKFPCLSAVQLSEKIGLICEEREGVD